MLSKGFFRTITIQNFSIRDRQVFLHIKRRRWPPWRGFIPKLKNEPTELGLK